MNWLFFCVLVICFFSTPRSVYRVFTNSSVQGLNMEHHLYFPPIPVKSQGKRQLGLWAKLAVPCLGVRQIGQQFVKNVSFHYFTLTSRISDNKSEHPSSRLVPHLECNVNGVEIKLVSAINELVRKSTRGVGFQLTWFSFHRLPCSVGVPD